MSNLPAVRKAVIPVAGLGARFLPATKSIPNELLTIVDRPIIEYVVEEARAAGIEQLIFVTGRGKEAIENHFDHSPELDAALVALDKSELAAATRSMLAPPGCMAFLRQQKPLGLGHAVACARHLVGNEPFAVLLPDMIVQPQLGEAACLAELLEVHRQWGGNVVGVEEIDPADAHKFGVVQIANTTGRTSLVTEMIEKPAPGTASSKLCLMGRYILQPEIFSVLARQPPSQGGEVQLTDAMRALLTTQLFIACRHGGRSFDCGSPAGFLAANLAFGIAHPEFGAAFKEALVTMMPEAGIEAMRRIIENMPSRWRGQIQRTVA